MHTRKSDEELLMQFAIDQGFDEPGLVEAVERLQRCHEDGTQDYLVD